MKVIRVESLGKCYTLKHQCRGGSGDGLRHAIQDAIGAPFRRLLRSSAQDSSLGFPVTEEFWALQNVSFTVREGEVVGIIGRNGAGKSTLLKILSRITEPTTGRIGLKGRVASLLEVGTGFHPELTGRENIFLNGAILGMSRAEVKRKFDEIVDFSGVEKFLDTPVKRYSSGMYVRLAFAVAAHLEPEILIVDEVLAVGDAGFQAKCLGKMQEVAGGGRTVLFVSHQMSAIQRLCSRVIWMEQGMTAGDGPPGGIIERYTRESVLHTAGIPLRQRRDRRGRGLFRFTGIEMQNPGGVGAPVTGAPLKIRLEIEPTEAGSIGRGARVSVAFTNSGDTLFICSSELCSKEELTLRGAMLAVCEIPRFPLGHGRYEITLYLEALGEPQDWIERGATVTVEAGDFFGSGRNEPHGHEGRNVLVEHVWHVEENASITA